MKTFKKILKWLAAIVLLLVVAGFALYWIYLRPVMQKMEQTQWIPYDKDLTLVLGGGGNSGILVSDSLIVVIDTKMGEAAEDLAKKVKELAGKKPILVVNTHYHMDHSKGNVEYKGQTILAGGNYTKQLWIEKAGEETLPTQWLKDSMDIRMGDDTLTLFNLARNAHTESDVVAYLHRRKLLFGGDVILNGQVPALHGAADPQGYMDAFKELPQKFHIEKIVPGHGPVGGLEVIESFRHYFLDMETAAEDKSQKDALVAKYRDWTQVPIMMSPGATISKLEEKPLSK